MDEQASVGGNVRRVGNAIALIIADVLVMPCDYCYSGAGAGYSRSFKTKASAIGTNG